MGRIITKSIAFWGAEAPPYGGMTVHIKRLSQHLQKNEWQVIQYNFDPEPRTQPYIKNIKSIVKWYISLWFRKSPKIHYVITTRSHIRFLACLLRLKGKKIIIRVGGQSLEIQLQKGGLSKIFNILSLKMCSAFIGVSENITDIAKKHMNTQKANHIPGFIPPQNEDSSVSNAITNFYNGKGLKLLVTGQMFDEGRTDIYGLYHYIDALKLLKEGKQEFKSVVAIYGTIDENFNANLMRLKKYVNESELQSDVLIHVNKDELWPLIKECDLFVRPSITDGDANAIREALYFNKSVIASDSVVRPDACILYENLNSEALATAIEKINTYNVKTENIIGNQILIEKLLLKLCK